jgi:hypothetical protein
MQHLRHGCVGPRRGLDAFGLLKRQLWSPTARGIAPALARTALRSTSAFDQVGLRQLR